MRFSLRKQLIVDAKSLTWLLITLSSLSLAPLVWSQDREQIKRGEYLARAGLCIDCHTDYKKKGVELAGGAPIQTPFGIIYSTNITPDRETGIGEWTDADFLRAMHQGIGREGEHLFPAFPYTTFTRMTDDDVLAIKAYLFSVPPVRQQNKPPELWPPFSWRFLLAGWNWMYFRAGRFTPDPKKPSQWNRGAYLVEAVAHCGECHTPRDLAGGLNKRLYMAGTEDGPEGEITPNITPHSGTGLGDWSVEDIAYLLKEGIKPDGDDVQGLMEEVIVHGYKYMTDEDRTAIAEYVRSLPPIDHRVEE
jgi:mono/diheme cytochrome c family protein